MSSPVVETRGLTRRFGRRVALDQADLTVEPGTIVGLVGPNGSGKTTLLKCLAGFQRASSGTARVHGLDPWRERAAVMASTRFAFAPPALFEGLTAREHLIHLASLGATPSRRELRVEIDAALERVGLLGRAKDRVGTFSFGMRQRLGLALATVPLPKLLVLDEPTDGLDPLAVLDLRRVLQDLRGEHGVTVLLSSHLLIEIDRLVDSMLVLNEGKTLFQGTPAEMCRGSERLRLLTDDAERAHAALREGGQGPELLEDGVLEVRDPSLTLESASELLRARGVELRSFHLHRPSLEQVLLARMESGDAEAAP